MRPSSPLARDYTETTGIVDDGAIAGAARGKLMPSGLHHLALMTADMQCALLRNPIFSLTWQRPAAADVHPLASTTIEFYERVLGMKLRAIFEMHGVPGAKHCFLEAGNGFEISFVQIDSVLSGAEQRAAVPGVDIPRSATGLLDDGSAMPGGVLGHIAMRCADAEELRAMVSQVAAAGVQISPIMDHGANLGSYSHFRHFPTVFSRF